MKEFEFTRYVVPLRDRMFRYAQSLLLCADEAEDVTHDLLERLWTERGRLDGCRDIASFVMAAVRNRCYDCLRRRRADAATMLWQDGRSVRRRGMPKGGKRVTWCAVRWRSCPGGSARCCT